MAEARTLKQREYNTNPITHGYQADTTTKVKENNRLNQKDSNQKYQP